MSDANDPNQPVTGYPAPPNARTNGYPPYPPSSNPYYNYPSNPYYPQGHQYNPGSARRANCLRRIFAFVIGLIVIFGSVTFIVWLVLRPQLPQFRVDSFTISNFTLGNNSLASFTSEIGLTARNPNKKMTLAYDHLEAGIFYDSESLSQTTVPPFWQDKRSEASLTANFAAAGSFVARPVADAINSDRSRNGNVDFNLRMLSRVRFEAKAWRARRRFLKVFCGGLIVEIPTSGRPGALIGGPRQCRVGI